MQLDDEVCLCFHVTKRKLVNFIRIEKPRRVAQLSECFGAGTGCGWCRTYMKHLFSAGETGQPEPTSADYARQRSRYIQQGGGTPPPGATPAEEGED